MIQLVSVFRKRNSDHSNPLGLPHRLIFFDTESWEDPEHGRENCDAYIVDLVSGVLDRDTINACFDAAEEKKSKGDKWHTAGTRWK